jgi:aminoglycoside phosphotransferase (APT) family kinase protein
MVKRPLDDLSEETAHELLARLCPGSSLMNVTLMPGSFSNHTHLVEARSEDGRVSRYALRRYQVFGNYDRGEKARREFKAFELMNRRGIPSPEPLLLDDTGELLGVPGIVEGFVEGRLMLETPEDPIDWARKAAVMLARIHSIPLSEADRSFLLKSNDEAVWFLYFPGGKPPDYMSSFPGGAELWEMIRDLHPRVKPVPPGLIHGDFWEGNILWNEGEISAVLDWEEAGYGDPAIDVSYALMNLRLRGLDTAAEAFLQAYESERGRKLENLGFWQLAAAVRPMVDLIDWNMDRPENMGRFKEFIAEAENLQTGYTG